MTVGLERSEDMTRKLGLVLGGGGGKGAYQVGVLKAFEEHGLTRHIKVLSGTSVGALNGVMLMQGDLALAEQAWLNISPSQVLGLDASNLLTRAGFQQLPAVVRAALGSPLRRGIFSHKGLEQLLKQYVRFDAVARSPISGYATCCCIWPPTGAAEYFRLNGISPDRLVQILLATSAIPLVFEDVEIDGKKYCDGGVVDNVPIRPVYEEGCDVVVVVQLDHAARDYSHFRGARFIQVTPSDNLGNILDGILDFDAANVRWRMDMGYRDGKAVVENILAALEEDESQVPAVNGTALSS